MMAEASPLPVIHTVHCTLESRFGSITQVPGESNA
jgi:hypothetical protein